MRYDAVIDAGQRSGRPHASIHKLAPPHSDLAQQTLKDPYVFDFLPLGPDAQERDFERGLLELTAPHEARLTVHGGDPVGTGGAPFFGAPPGAPLERHGWTA